MKNKKMNNKGFTLIELLAVIVILAVLILLAMPQVLTMMENARKSAFKTEAQGILNQVENVFVQKTINGGVSTINIQNVTNGALVNGSFTQYKYLCVTLKDLYDGGYMDKNFEKQGYSGIIEVFVPASGKATYGISISNGTYGFETVNSEILSLESVQATNTATAKLTTCPNVSGTNNKSVGRHPECYKADPGSTAAPTKATLCGLTPQVK